MRRSLGFLVIVILSLAACSVPPPPEEPSVSSPVPTSTAPPEAASAPSPTTKSVAPDPFDISWDDRAIFSEGLTEAEQAVLDQLSGATVYHIDLQIPDDFLVLEGREEVRHTNQEEEPLNEIYFRLFPNVAGGEATVSAVKVDGQNLELVYEFQNSALRVPLRRLCNLVSRW